MILKVVTAIETVGLQAVARLR